MESKSQQEEHVSNHNVMFWNCKTSGFPERIVKQTNRSGKGEFFPPNQIDKYNNSRLVGLSFIIVTPDLMTEIFRGSVLIKHTNTENNEQQSFNINPSATRSHGITNEMIQKEGIDFHDFVTGFMNVLQAVKHIVGHSVLFDKNVLFAECMRNNELELMKMLEDTKLFHCSILQYQMVTNDFTKMIKQTTLCETLKITFSEREPKSKEELCLECFRILINVSETNPFLP